MTFTWRHGVIFASGLLVGIAAAWFLMASPTPHDTAAAPAIAPAPIQKAAPAAPAVAPPAVSVASASCKLEPALPAAGAKDGQYVLKTELSANKATDVGLFIVIGKEAAAAGRPRDAEVAFLMSCRLAEQFKGVESTEAADAKYQLGRHYAQAVAGAPNARRAELDRRSELLYSESLRTYLTVYGQSHEKTRFASEGLARLKQTIAQAPRPPAAPVVANKPAGPAAPSTAPAPVARAPAALPAAAPVARTAPPPRAEAVAKAEPPPPWVEPPPRVRPSFDCSRARSRSERLICSDEELAQLDRELGRLHARARNDSPDPAGFKRRSDEEWRRRESTCRDKECLLDWYAQRREQLLDEEER